MLGNWFTRGKENPIPQAALPKIGLALFFTLLVFILFIPLKSYFNFYDEGFAVFNATRVLNHEAPYRDFWAIYPPGQLYLLAGVFKIFGISLYASRIYDTLVRVILVLGFFLVSRKFVPRKYGYVATFCLTLVLASQAFYSYAVYPALAVSIYAIYCTLEYFQHSARRWLIASGIITGLACIIRWDIGLYVCLGLCVALFIYEFTQAWRKPCPLVRSAVAALKVAILPFAVTLVILLVGYSLVSLRSGVANVWDQVFYFPATQLRAVRWLAYPELFHPHIDDISNFWNIYTRPMDWLRFYLPLLIYLTAWIYIVLKVFIQRAAFTLTDFGIMAAASCGPFLFSQALSRYDYIHVLPALIPAGLVVAGLFPRVLSGSAHWRTKTFLVFVLLGVACVYFLGPLNEVMTSLDNYPLDSCRSELARASCVPTNENQALAVGYIQASTQENEPIFVGNQRHDILFVNDVGFYYLAARPSATRYSELHPGIANLLPYQEEIVTDLDTKQVKYIVLVDIWLSTEPNDSSKSTGVTYLDTYIRQNYMRVAAFGEYEVWQRSP